MLELHSKTVGNKKLRYFTQLRKGSSEFWPLATLFPPKKKKKKKTLKKKSFSALLKYGNCLIKKNS